MIVGMMALLMSDVAGFGFSEMGLVATTQDLRETEIADVPLSYRPRLSCRHRLSYRPRIEFGVSAPGIHDF
jgi:hypothetical protein